MLLFVGIQLGLVSSKVKSQGPSGLYVTAVANGIQEILDRYSDVVVELETRILENPYITLTEMKVALEAFRSIFRTLASLMKKVFESVLKMFMVKTSSQGLTRFSELCWLIKIQTQRKSSGLIVEILKAEYDLNIPIQDELQM